MEVKITKTNNKPEVQCDSCAQYIKNPWREEDDLNGEMRRIPNVINYKVELEPSWYLCFECDNCDARLSSLSMKWMSEPVKGLIYLSDIIRDKNRHTIYCAQAKNIKWHIDHIIDVPYRPADGGSPQVLEWVDIHTFIVASRPRLAIESGAFMARFEQLLEPYPKMVKWEKRQKAKIEDIKLPEEPNFDTDIPF